MKYPILSLLFSIVSFGDAAYLRRSPKFGLAGGIGSLDKDTRRHTNTTIIDLHSSRPTFKLKLNNHRGVQYTAPITLDNQTLEAVYDTGSFEIMAISRDCSVCKIASHLNTYDNRSSSSFKKGDRPMEPHYFAGGTVVARQDFETVHVGTVDSVFKVDNMAFWQVLDTNMPVWKNKMANFTAIVGMGHRGVVPHTPGDKKPMDSLIERTGTQRFAICLMRGPANPGYLVFNPPYDVTSSSIAPMFRKLPVIGENHWAVKLNSVSTVFNKQPQRTCADGSECVAIIDSGTSLIGVPPNAVPMVMNIINQVMHDCSNLDELPPLVFDLAGHKFSMPGAAYVVQFGEKGDKPTHCIPAFTDFAMTSDQGVVWILGMPFLRHFYTVFDREEPSIYVADQGENCEPTANTDVNSSFFNASRMASSQLPKRSQPTIADLSQASLPSWATRQKKLIL